MPIPEDELNNNPMSIVNSAGISDSNRNLNNHWGIFKSFWRITFNRTSRLLLVKFCHKMCIFCTQLNVQSSPCTTKKPVRLLPFLGLPLFLPLLLLLLLFLSTTNLSMPPGTTLTVSRGRRDMLKDDLRRNYWNRFLLGSGWARQKNDICVIFLYKVK